MISKNNTIPLITSYANVACVFSLVYEIEKYAEWFFENYTNLFWNTLTNELYPCNYKNQNNYKNIINSPFLSTIEVSCDEFTIEKAEAWLKSGNKILCPINTQKMGITYEKEFIHDIFISASLDTNFKVYDFWAPKFIWGQRLIEKRQVHRSIDITNPNLNDKILIIKNNKEQPYTTRFSLKELIFNYLYPEKIGVKSTGINIYINVIEHLECCYGYEISLSVFQILVDHFTLLLTLLPMVLKKIIQNDSFINHITEKTTIIFNKAIYLRNYIMKSLYQKEIITNKNNIIDKIHDIRNYEYELLNEIYRSIEH